MVDYPPQKKKPQFILPPLRNVSLTSIHFKTQAWGIFVAYTFQNSQTRKVSVKIEFVLMFRFAIHS